MNRSRRWWSEPTLHFMAVGGLLVLLQAWSTHGSGPHAIIVSSELVRGLRADYARRTGTLPDDREQAALVEDYVRNEMLYREALRLGLDKGDIVVRRRMIQKMQFLLEDEDPIAEPSDDELTAYLRAHASRYAKPARVAISHVFVDAQRHAEPRAVASGLAEELARGASPGDLGDAFLRGRELPLYTETDLASVFGPGFAMRVMKLPLGEWSMPIPSVYGQHLILVRERQPTHDATLAEARAAVSRDWRAERRDRANQRSLARLRDAYDVRLETGGDA